MRIAGIVSAGVAEYEAGWDGVEPRYGSFLGTVNGEGLNTGIVLAVDIETRKTKRFGSLVERLGALVKDIRRLGGVDPVDNVVSRGGIAARSRGTIAAVVVSNAFEGLERLCKTANMRASALV